MPKKKPRRIDAMRAHDEWPQAWETYREFMERKLREEGLEPPVTRAQALGILIVFLMALGALSKAFG